MADDMVAIFTKLHDMETKTQQDVYLQSLMEVSPVNRPRSRPGSSSTKPKSVVVKYHIMHNGVRTKICKNGFMKSYGCTSKQCYRLSHLLQLSKTPIDKRGRNVSGNAIPGTVITCLRAHIEQYPRETEHYTGRDKEYLPANLNVKTMYEMFINKHKYFLLATLGSEKRLSYKVFWHYFKENYSLRFGQPAKDACIACEELKLKIKSPFLNDNEKRHAIAELMVHNRRAKKFYNKIKDTTEKCIKGAKQVGLCIDYMSNVTLPCIPVQDTYYFRKLIVNVFGIHDIASRKMSVFIYHEGEGGKGSNEVCSMLMWYVKNKISDEVKTLHLFGDNCAGQNKNHTLVRLMMALCEIKRFDKINLVFPVRGHSFIPNDRDFGIIRRKLKKLERYYETDEVINLINSSSNIPGKFNVKKMSFEDFIDYGAWWPKFYKRTCLSNDSYGKKVLKSNKITFSISKYCEMSVSSDEPAEIECSMHIAGLISDIFRLRNTIGDFELPTNKAYSAVLSINHLKIVDIKKTLVYIPVEKLRFWNEITLWPVTTVPIQEDQPTE